MLSRTRHTLARKSFIRRFAQISTDFGLFSVPNCAHLWKTDLSLRERAQIRGSIFPLQFCGWSAFAPFCGSTDFSYA